MCWLPTDQPLLWPGDLSCSARARRPSACSVAKLFASRLRMIGDQVEMSWTARETEVGFRCWDRGMVVVTGRGHLKSFLCLAVHVALLVLFGARRHL